MPPFISYEEEPEEAVPLRWEVVQYMLTHVFEYLADVSRPSIAVVGWDYKMAAHLAAWLPVPADVLFSVTYNAVIPGGNPETAVTTALRDVPLATASDAMQDAVRECIQRLMPIAEAERLLNRPPSQRQLTREAAAERKRKREEDLETAKRLRDSGAPVPAEEEAPETGESAEATITQYRLRSLRSWSRYGKACAAAMYPEYPTLSTGYRAPTTIRQFPANFAPTILPGMSKGSYS